MINFFIRRDQAMPIASWEVMNKPVYQMGYEIKRQGKSAALVPIDLNLKQQKKVKFAQAKLIEEAIITPFRIDGLILISPNSWM